MKRTILFLLIVHSFIISCASPSAAQSVPSISQSPEAIRATATPQVLISTEEAVMTFTLTSSTFAQGQPIPRDYSCKGRDISPALAWTEPPVGTQAFALIMDDPDAPAGTWVHWVIFNIPASARALNEAMPTGSQLADGSVQGKTSAGSSGYHGPCPPSGTHRYFFKLYAVDGMLNLTASADKQALLKAMEGHILAQAELMGTFSK
jgi:Raf kinase inhibitor-like YbhB/YbcL family protein